MDFSNLLKFLKDLEKNNTKEWFHENNETYQKLRSDFIQFVGQLIEEIAKFDKGVAGLDPKKCIFRINRDIRFSKEKSPYKTNFGAAMGEGGKKTEKAGYYFHAEPGKSFIAGGIWMPSSEVLSNIRQEIDYNQDEFKKLLETKDFKKYFGELEGESLKTAPKGYTTDHPLIEVIRQKSFVMTHYYEDKELKEIKAKEVAGVFEKMKPVNDFLNRSFD